MSALNKAEKERDATKVTITWLEQRLNDHATTPITQTKVQHYLSTVDVNEKKIEDTFQRIVAIVDPADLDPHIQEYMGLLDRALELKDQLTLINQAFPSASTSSSVSSSTATAKIRLPQLELPTFDGTLQDWESFRDMFVTAVKDNDALSKSQKLTYLKSQLKGEAARQLSSLTISDANFDIAWTQLSDRYQNDRELLFAILRRFLNQPIVQSQSASSIRQLIDVSQESIRSLKVLKLPTDQWDAILLFLVMTKMDSMSKELWEQTLKDSSIPTLKALFEFLEQRARALAASGINATESTSTSRPAHGGKNQMDKRLTRSQTKSLVHHTTKSSEGCKVCDESHYLFRCDKFLAWSTQQRGDFVRKNNLCYNCLRDNHRVAECPNNKGCRACGYKHHTLLHKASNSGTKSSEAPVPTSQVHFTTSHSQPAPNEYDTLLATALVKATDKHGHVHTFRALADNGSNTHYATDSCIRRIRAPMRRCLTSAIGLGGASVANATGVSQFMVSSHFDPSITFLISRCLVTSKITGKLPTSAFDHTKWSHLQGLQLADPNYHLPQDVDMLLGAEFFFAIMESGKRSGPTNSPAAIKTSFGWLVGGGSSEIPFIPRTHAILSPQISSGFADSTSKTSNELDEHLDTTLRRFWEMECEPTTRLPTPEEAAAEAHFVSTCRQGESGRFIVQLPFKAPRPPLGPSLNIAMKRLQYLERRLKSNPEARKEYLLFMREYEDLGHMEEVKSVDKDSSQLCYIPHHFVVKESSSTTKFRVVFDASAKTSNGVSLNEGMMVGPTIQDSLVDILCRFRLHKIAFTADIAKMYRQILVSPEETDLQRILWRDDPTKPVKHYRLLTVTYGTAAAPFLATRVLQELATLSKSRLPRASDVALRDFYVDDLMSGEPTIQEALETQQQLLKLMQNGSLCLRKWTSNSQAMLDSIPPEMRETQSLLSFDEDSTVKALGICWNPKSDQFLFRINFQTTQGKPFTKRNVLSELARLFDPIGWLAPIIISSKVLMQSLWKLQQGWDDPLPPAVQQKWTDLRTDMKGLSNLTISRFFMQGSDLTCPSLNIPCTTAVKFCLAGFCDSSELAYAAVVYLCAYDDHSSSVSLVSSKTRVAPVKTVSLPRLELCGATLLAEHISSVQAGLRIPIHSITAWTDSTVSLDWIQSSPSRWKTFVANRVTKIQEKVPSILWGFVPGEENPADCASRGITCEELINHSLWWHGPSWLKDSVPVPRRCHESNTALSEVEAKKVKILHTLTTSDQLLLDRYSSLSTLLRVTAFILRFIKNFKRYKDVPVCAVPHPPGIQILKPALNHPNTRSKTIPIQIKSKPTIYLTPLTPLDLNQARLYWIKIIQHQSFPDELQALKEGTALPRKSKIVSLSPILDSDGVLKVGGRLKHSSIPVDQKHPILLPSHNRFTKLLIQEMHLRNFHAGPQLLMSTLQRRYWIVRAKDAIRHQIRKCVLCSRLKAQTLQQVMGDLPAFRVTPARPFLKTGVDYAGPFLLRPIQPRSKITIKAYLAVFVCCTTRALHLEVVSKADTDAFLASLRRFVSRRGRPTDLYSDCGSNFVGANREMKEMLQLVLSNTHNQTVADQMTKEGTSWHFNPPAAPHFGGLWEAGVKSVKYHLRRIMGNQRLTFEELTTVISQIEAILNSRPLTPESPNPDDFNALTPGHFLIGAPLNSVPEPSLGHVNINCLSRWQLLQQMVQSFWKRWSNEYLTRLQQRPKWISGDKKISVGDMVIIKDENSHPLKWQLGRVQILHPGPDSITRVVTVQTSTGTLKRPVVKLCLLPVDHSTPPDQLTKDPALNIV